MGKKTRAPAKPVAVAGLGNGGIGPSTKKVPDTVALPDGTQIPVGLPPGVDPALAQQAIEYLKSNPAQAKATFDQVQRLMGNPEMAKQLMASQAAMSNPAYREQMAVLREDPELKPIFERIASSGTAAMEEYWNDKELMSKISGKMAALSMERKAASPSSQKPQPPPENLHDACKQGKLDAVQEFLGEGADVNAADGRGIRPLGVAVGFNRLPVIKALLDAGAHVDSADGKGNTALHYAAGYGRREAAELLLGAGAAVDAKNDDDQTPIEVAEKNLETHMVRFLEERGGSTKPFSDKYL